MHKAVLLNEAIRQLDVQESDKVFDGTFGAGGHSAAICARLGEEGVLIAVDRDNSAILSAKEIISKCVAKTFLINGDFRDIDTILYELGYENIDKILFDLGISSTQLEESGRGFSFQKEEPLLMTLDNSADNGRLTAKDIVNTWSEENIADILYGFGGERFSRRIAKNIVEHRATEKIDTTKALVEIIKDSVPKRYAYGRIHPATRVFQALRIAVNDELGALSDGLRKGVNLLSVGGVIAVITFHSLEDRIVKTFFREQERDGNIIVKTKKPICPDREELENNPRARSAKLRVAEKK